MKLVVLQITNSALKLTPVDKLSAKCIYGMPITFGLPTPLQQGEALNHLPELAAFTKECMCCAGLMKKKANLTTPKILFCLEDEKLTTKEYQHLPTKKSNVQSFVNLEAEAVLQDSAKNYVIENYEYNKLDARTGKLKGMLYAAHSQLIYNISREFKRFSMNVVKIMPPINGLVNAAKALFYLPAFNQNYKDKTFAFIDIGYEKIRMVLFSKSVLIFERTFEPIYNDILQIISRELQLSLADAEKLIYQEGVPDTFPESASSEESKRQLQLLLETTSSEIVRNIRMVLSSERLDLESIVFCGAFSSQPNFEKFITELALDTPFENIENYTNQMIPGILLDRQAAQLGCHAADFFSINGLITEKTENSIDFLRPVKNVRNDRIAKISIMAAMTVLALAVMLLPVFLLLSAQMQNTVDAVALANPKYSEPLSQLEQQKKLNAQIAAEEQNTKALPYGKSKTNEILDQVFNTLSKKVLNISSCKIDNTAGTVAISFTTATLEDYLAFREAVKDTGYFTIPPQFDVTTDAATKVCTCNLTLTIKDFKPYPSTSSQNGGKGGSSK